MATIALHANKINQMPDLIKSVKESVDSYKSGLSELKTKMLKITSSICNLDDVINSIQTSTQTQEDKLDSLDTFSQNCETFMSDAVRIDGDAAEIVRQRKDDFYAQYEYLKPECEKSDWEKFIEGCKKVGEWCKEHWVTIVTAIVVVVIAAVAVICGVAVAFIATVAGIVAMAVCLADVICMLVTGGKDIATVLRENGLNVLADIFQGVSIGADIVSIVFPLGSAIKTMAKVGVKTFVKGSIKAAKIAFKETIEKVFKSGFKNGVKNFFTISFKTFIFDADDLKNWKAVTLKMSSPNKNWIIDGNQLIPNSNVVPGKNNPDGLSMYEIMKQEKFSNFPDTIPYKNGYPDLSGFSVAEADINMKNLDIDEYTEDILSGTIEDKKFQKIKRFLRNNNFKQANAALPDGITKSSLEKQLGYKLTWHEDLSLKKCFLVPTEIHANVGHTGAVANYKFNFKNIPGISNLIGEKVTQWGIRSALNMTCGAAT